MSEAEENAQAVSQSGKAKWIVIVGIVLFIGLTFKFLLPKGFSDDLSRTGKGQPTVVLVRDIQTVQSQELMDVMSALRDQYAGKIEFLLIDHNTPEGKQFMAANEAERVTLVLLDAQGKRVKILYVPQTEESLAQELNAVLGAPL